MLYYLTLVNNKQIFAWFDFSLTNPPYIHLWASTGVGHIIPALLISQKFDLDKSSAIYISAELMIKNKSKINNVSYDKKLTSSFNP